MEPKLIKNRIALTYCFAIGIFSILAWTYMLITDNLPRAHPFMAVYILRWFTEFIGGVFLIVAGMSCYKRYSMRRAWLYIALGFNIASSLFSFFGYFIHFAMKPFLLYSSLFILSLLLAGWNYRNWKDIIFSTLSFSIYASINILAISLAKIKPDILILSIPLILSLIVALITFYNVTHYKETIEKGKDT